MLDCGARVPNRETSHVITQVVLSLTIDEGELRTFRKCSVSETENDITHMNTDHGVYSL
jgi:hypothetical protein